MPGKDETKGRGQNASGDRRLGVAVSDGAGVPTSAGSTRLEQTAQKLSAASRVLAACTSLVYRAGMLALIVLAVAATYVLVSRFGWLLTAAPTDRAHVRYAGTPRVVGAVEPIPWEKVDAAVAEAARNARGKAEKYAAGELEQWKAQLLTRIDDDFLPWYFSYWNQQRIGLAAAWQGVKHQLAGYITDENTPSPSEQMAAEIQQEFANRVLRPEGAQFWLEQLTRKTVEMYLAELRQELAAIQAQYKIPQPQWDRYLEDIAVTTQRVEGGRQVPLSLKAVTASSVGAGAVLASSLARVSARLEARLAGKAVESVAGRAAAGAAAGTAGKASAKVVAKTGARFLGPVLTVAVIAWDMYDHLTTVGRNKPILRESLAEYLSLLNESLLHDPQTGVASAIHEIEAGIVKSLAKDSPQTALARQDQP